MGVEGRKHDILGAEKKPIVRYVAPVVWRLVVVGGEAMQSLRNYLHLLSANVRL
jgi:hypothetical protein